MDFYFFYVLFTLGAKGFALRDNFLRELFEIVRGFEKLGDLASVVSAEVLCCKNDLFDLFLCHASSL